MIPTICLWIKFFSPFRFWQKQGSSWEKEKPTTQKPTLSNAEYENKNLYLFMFKPLSVYYEIKPLFHSTVKHKIWVRQ